MIRTSLALAISVATMVTASAQVQGPPITVYGPNGSITTITPGVWGKDTYVVHEVFKPTPPPVYEPLPPRPAPFPIPK